MSATDAWAVGTVCEDGTTQASNCRGLAMHLSGNTWNQARTAGGAQFNGIAAHTPTNVWLGGYAAFDATTDTDHVEQWNGTTLTTDDTVSTTIPVFDRYGQLGSALAAIATDHAGGLWAVGWTRRTGRTSACAT